MTQASISVESSASRLKTKSSRDFFFSIRTFNASTSARTDCTLACTCPSRLSMRSASAFSEHGERTEEAHCVIDLRDCTADWPQVVPHLRDARCEARLQALVKRVK